MHISRAVLRCCSYKMPVALHAILSPGQRHASEHSSLSSAMQKYSRQPKPRHKLSLLWSRLKNAMRVKKKRNACSLCPKSQALLKSPVPFDEEQHRLSFLQHKFAEHHKCSVHLMNVEQYVQCRRHFSWSPAAESLLRSLFFKPFCISFACIITQQW